MSSSEEANPYDPEEEPTLCSAWRDGFLAGKKARGARSDDVPRDSTEEINAWLDGYAAGKGLRGSES